MLTKTDTENLRDTLRARQAKAEREKFAASIREDTWRAAADEVEMAIYNAQKHRPSDEECE